MGQEILDLIKSKGILLDKEIFDLVGSFGDVSLAKKFLENLEKVSGSKMISRSTLTKNYEFVQNVVKGLPGETKSSVEKIFVKLGISLEIKKEKMEDSIENFKKEVKKDNYKVFYSTHDNNKKIGVQDFVGHFRSRYQTIQRILMQRPGLSDLTSINKISGDRRSFTIIGIVSSKRITKNKNLIISFEDLTGQINALVKHDKECFVDAGELQLDDIVAVKCSGSNEMVFVHEIIYPDAFLLNKPSFDEDICVAFISDIHAGSNKHLGEEFDKFIDWLDGDNELAKKIRYLFIVGDNVDGVGVFPGQENLLKIKDLKSQYDLLASYLRKVPDHITMFMCPGQHDSVRVPEPQPVIDNKYGGALHEIPNLTLVSNPSKIKLIEDDKEFNILMYHGASIHGLISNISDLRLIKAHKCPAKAVRHMLKRRHLAPTHSSVVYVPNAEKDPMVIDEVPNVLCTGEVHKLDIERHNGVLIITGSCWQAKTDFEEKVGNEPDPCKVPILNLKTGELKVLDFSEGGE